MTQETTSRLNKRIFVAGHRGMVGSAIVRALKKRDYSNIITRTHAEVDMTDQAQVRAFFETEKIDEVYLAAARVGGIHANNTYPADFIYQNLMIKDKENHETKHNNETKQQKHKTTNNYPRLAEQPIREEYLLTGTLE